MKRLICIGVFFLVFCASLNIAIADESVDPEVRAPADIAKEYIAKKYNCNVDDLTVGDSIIGRGGASVDINHGYDTEKVRLKRKDFESEWEIEGSEPLHEY